MIRFLEIDIIFHELYDIYRSFALGTKIFQKKLTFLNPIN